MIGKLALVLKVLDAGQSRVLDLNEGPPNSNAMWDDPNAEALRPFDRIRIVGPRHSNVNTTQVTEDLLVEEYTKLDTKISLGLGRPGQRKLGDGLLSLGPSSVRVKIALITLLVPCCKKSVA